MTAEEELKAVRAAASGDGAAFERIVREHQKNVYSLAWKLTGNEQDALDASQDAFLKAYQNLRSFRGDSRLSVWLYRLTYNASMDIIKRSRRGKLVPMPTDEEGGALDEDKRTILIMREYQSMSYTDIARALSLEEGTVKSRLARARASLAEILKKRGTIAGGAQSNNQNAKTREVRRRGRS